jgi:hypothetical protein
MLTILYDPAIPTTSPSLQPEHAKLTGEMRANGHYHSGGGLYPASMYDKRVRVDESGTPVIVDGPFAESKEVLGGYYVIECSEEEALAYAKRIPVDRGNAHVQVRRMGIYQPPEGNRT